MDDPLLQALSESNDDLIAALKTVARAEVCVVVTRGALVGLNLDGSKITDAGLEKLGGQEQLRWLGLAGTGVSPEGVAALRERLPGCNVLH
ncbi:MAG TPA: hypothetical protein EYQ62_05150 [Verrucomicrobiales bacterium]|jgi:hypothetical protein|nr:hypothetical protein [Verrucomicrobiales bacterium]HIL25072.1 hypothetical protein [Verrucomicrobiota bacterium]